ncbi:MAG: DUF5069 domain-containing protein [Verrucomicrobia bacterium]|nr:DUF5069 domain-containing protein [Verrucomicrobiota bacterium]
MLPPPRARLADCSWLPRIAAKVREIRAGALPPEYLARFCAPDSVDHYFLQHFGLTKEAVIEAVSGCENEAEVAEWFTRLPGVDGDRIAAWNARGESLGQPGQPMEERLRAVLATTYAHLDHSRIRSIYDVIERDEAAPGS